MAGTIGLSVFLAQHWNPKQCCLVGENDLDALGGKWGVYKGYLCWPQQLVGLWGHSVSGGNEVVAWWGLRINLSRFSPAFPLLWLQKSLDFGPLNSLCPVPCSSSCLGSTQRAPLPGSLPWFSFLKFQIHGRLVLSLSLFFFSVRYIKYTL